jgi:hypothetical protein
MPLAEVREIRDFGIREIDKLRVSTEERIDLYRRRMTLFRQQIEAYLRWTRKHRMALAGTSQRRRSSDACAEAAFSGSVGYQLW